MNSNEGFIRRISELTVDSFYIKDRLCRHVSHTLYSACAFFSHSVLRETNIMTFSGL